jgi:hypothetical protein
VVATVRAFPFDRLRRVARDDAAIESAAARWLGAAALPADRRLGRLCGGAVRVIALRSGARPIRDAIAACEVRIDGEAVAIEAPGAAVRRLAQRVLGGPDELAAPRPLSAIERALLALAVAAALEDLGVAGEAWPIDRVPDAGALAFEIVLDVAGVPTTIVAHVPRALVVRVPPERPLAAWSSRVVFDMPIVLGRCAIAARALAALALRDVITLERAAGDAELVVGAGAIGIAAARGAVEATVATGYVSRDMALPDDAHLELAVVLGTTRMTLRQLAELARGQIVPLGRPLAGPFELRAGGQLVGRGELVDIDGELGVRVTSLGDEQRAE